MRHLNMFVAIWPQATTFLPPALLGGLVACGQMRLLHILVYRCVLIPRCDTISVPGRSFAPRAHFSHLGACAALGDGVGSLGSARSLVVGGTGTKVRRRAALAVP